MRSTGIQLRWATIVLLLLAASMPIFVPNAIAIDNNCYYKVVGTATITTYGEIINPDGSKSYVPMGGVTYVYYQSYCDASGVYSSDPTEEPIRTPMRPRVALKTIDTTDPYRPLLVVDVDSDPYYPAKTLTVSVGGVTLTQLPLVGDGQYEVALRSVSEYPSSSTKAIVATACGATSTSCGSVSGSMTRYKPSPPSRSETLVAMYLSGDEFFRQNYGHQYIQEYMTTSFSMAELGQNSRRQLRQSLVKLQWSVAGYDATFNARVQATGILYGNTFTTTPSCFNVPTCYGGCAHKCIDTGAFGFMISTKDGIGDLLLKNSWQLMSVASGGTLSLTVP